MPNEPHSRRPPLDPRQSRRGLNRLLDLSLDSDQTTITGWRERLLFRILYCAFVLGSIAYAFNTLIALQSQQWLRVAAYTTIYAGGILITLVRGIPYTLRAWAVLSLPYLLGVLSLATIGPASSGRMWLLTFTISKRTLALKSANLKLQQAQKMEAIGTLAGGIAHDFNNLLMAIQGNTSLLLFDMDASTPQFQALKNIEHTVASGKKLTQQILGYARKGNYLPRPIALNPIVRETAQTVAGTRKGTTLHLELAEDLMAVSADEAQMLQVLLNLFVNAAEAMPTGGRLQATTSNVTHADIRSRSFVPDAGRYDGREVFHRMKAIHPQVKVLLSSGYSLDTRIEDMLTLGCMDFIQKPHSIESLSAKIMAIVGGGVEAACSEPQNRKRPRWKRGPCGADLGTRGALRCRP